MTHSTAKVILECNSTCKEVNLFPAGIYLLKVNNRNTRTRCEICSKLTIKTPDYRLYSFIFIDYILTDYINF